MAKWGRDRWGALPSTAADRLVQPRTRLAVVLVVVLSVSCTLRAQTVHLEGFVSSCWSSNLASLRSTFTSEPHGDRAWSGAFQQSETHNHVAAFVASTALVATSAFILKTAARRQRTQAHRGSSVRCNAVPQVFGNPGTRSPLVNWYLLEIGQEFEMVDAVRVDRSTPDYPHPFGQIPALRDGDVSVFESGAILMYLADKYGGLDTPEKRAEANKWVVWANATLDGICFKEDGNGRVLDTGLRGDPKQITRLDQILGKQEFILGDGEESFSVADVAIGAYLLYVPIFFNDVSVAKWPNVQRYMLQLCQRPAYAKAFGGGTSKDLVEIISKSEGSKLFGLF